MDNSFKIEKGYGSLLIGQDGKCLGMDRRIDGDLWISSSSDLEIPITKYNSFRYGVEETSTYNLFEKLMIVVFGRYVLKDYGDEYSDLPKDFIDLDNKTITWHSDGGGNATLQLKAVDNQIIISILGQEKDDKTRWVRVRTSGSEYGEYYNYFISLYRDLEKLIDRIEKQEQGQAIL